MCQITCKINKLVQKQFYIKIQSSHYFNNSKNESANQKKPFSFLKLIILYRNNIYIFNSAYHKHIELPKIF